jgi:hypothetical protein
LQAEQDPADPDSAMSVKANLLIMWGNALYEHSHLRAAGGADWKSLVEAAATKFREAGAWREFCQRLVDLGVLGLIVRPAGQGCLGRPSSKGRRGCVRLATALLFGIWGFFWVSIVPCWLGVAHAGGWPWGSRDPARWQGPLTQERGKEVRAQKRWLVLGDECCVHLIHVDRAAGQVQGGGWFAMTCCSLYPRFPANC